MVKVWKNGQQKACNKKRARCLAILLKNKLNSDVARFTILVQTS